MGARLAVGAVREPPLPLETGMNAGFSEHFNLFFPQSEPSLILPFPLRTIPANRGRSVLFQAFAELFVGFAAPEHGQQFVVDVAESDPAVRRGLALAGVLGLVHGDVGVDAGGDFAVRRDE